MKTKEEIEQLAEQLYPIKRGGLMWMPSTNDIKQANIQEGFINGYSKCQQDMVKELEELRESIRKNTWYDEDGNAQVNLYGINNNLLNKQD